jgi:glycolate oxidase
LAGSYVEELARALPAGRVRTDRATLLVHGYDASTAVKGLPEVVVCPETEQEVVATLQIADEARVPVFARGAGTGLAAGSVPQGGIALSLSTMRRIKEVDVENLMAVVEPGVVNAHLQAAVEAHGLFYPPDPASLKSSTLGGNVATGAGGPRCLKYGTTREYVRGIRAVLPGGRIISDGGKYLKSATGYNLSQLFTGSEGTLGVITEITVRLIPKPPATGTVMALFTSLEAATTIVGRIFASGILPSVMEFMDALSLRCVNEAYGMGLPEGTEAMMLIECDGRPEAISADIASIAEMCAEGGATVVRRATEEAERALLWKARRSVSPALSRLRPVRLGEDISLPRAAIVPMVREIQRIASDHQLMIPTFGHIGDGNLHPNILYDPRDEAEAARVGPCAEALVRAAVAHGGTLSGEHGIGLLKRDLLPIALPPVNIELYRQIKAVFDPHGIMNPGKVFTAAALAL